MVEVKAGPFTLCHTTATPLAIGTPQQRANIVTGAARDAKLRGGQRMAHVPTTIASTQRAYRKGSTSEPRSRAKPVVPTLLKTEL